MIEETRAGIIKAVPKNDEILIRLKLIEKGMNQIDRSHLEGCI
jgi:hypothetical protein